VGESLGEGRTIANGKKAVNNAIIVPTSAMSQKQYVISIAGGTATASITMTQNGTLKSAAMVFAAGAAGSWELSLSSSSQIASATPDTSVLARIRVGTILGGTYNVVFPLNVPVKAFQIVYLHCTGAGNVGELTLQEG